MQGITYGIIVAGGSGSRYGGSMPKQYLPMGRDGRPVLMYSIDAMLAICRPENLRIVIAEDCLGLWQKLSKSSPLYASLKIVCGGASRWQSVHNGLASLPPTTPGDIVLVHDGARPVVPPEVVHAVAEAAAERLAAIPAVAVTDSLRCLNADGTSHAVDRSRYYAVQTPQVFDRDLLAAALQNAKTQGLAVTDDCSAVEALGMPVQLTDGDEENLKITTPLDLELAALILRRRAEA